MRPGQPRRCLFFRGLDDPDARALRSLRDSGASGAPTRVGGAPARCASWLKGRCPPRSAEQSGRSTPGAGADGTRGMNLEGSGRGAEFGMSAVSCGNGKLRQWLIDQIDSGKYPGLVWENEEKSIFRIPWKHAGKQDYNREEDAALFKAWALFKGKFREGIDKPDPPTWKTRLRCALNKSNDFEELVERSQLDISDPYKVYRIVPEGAKKGAKQLTLEDPQMSMSHPYTMTTPYPSLPAQQVHNYVMPPLDRSWRDYVPDQPHPEIPYQCPVTFGPRSHHWQGPACENDCRLHICLYYREILVKELTTSSPEGCRISHGHTYDASNLDQVLFPYPEDNGQRKNIEKLLGHLERGVVLWMAPDGLYAKRLCQSRIYWDGPLALCSDRPNKLERDQTCKLFDTQQFLSGEALHSVRTEVVMARLPQGSETTGSLSPQAEVFLLLTPAPTGLGAWPLAPVEIFCLAPLRAESPDQMVQVDGGSGCTLAILVFNSHLLTQFCFIAL
ncbi:interferon regulatory factor 4 isoform X5 [Papio anubis]|uniref:interferon regulatory factor 4 isoform X5 n=1 Tax=Papio anubis TaxID=9555 RepID=UPI0012AEAE48|nr:interferon regulatory factor 4 isoform X5 [Papio anubis]